MRGTYSGSFGMVPHRPSGSGGSGGSGLSSALKAMESANTANEMRYGQAMAIYDEIINRYQPGGSFETKSLAQIEKGKARDVGGAYQGMISSGLSGVTKASQLGTTWESEVGSGKRLALEDIMMQRLSGAQQQKAGFIERREDTGPSYGDLMQIAQAGGKAAGQAGSGFQSIISGGSGLPTNYNPLNDPSRHSTGRGGNVSGSVQVSGSGSSGGSVGSAAGGSYGQGLRQASIPQELLESSGIYQEHKQYSGDYNTALKNIEHYQAMIQSDPKNAAVYESGLKQAQKDLAAAKKP